MACGAGCGVQVRACGGAQGRGGAHLPAPLAPRPFRPRTALARLNTAPEISDLPDSLGESFLARSLPPAAGEEAEAEETALAAEVLLAAAEDSSRL